MTVQAEVVPGIEPTTVVRQLEPAIEEFRRELPAGYAVVLGGVIEDSAKAQASIFVVFPLMLFLMTSLGALVAIPVAWLLKRTFFRGETPPFVMELPSYKWPSPRMVAQRVWDRAWAFIANAGTLILATNILVWAACYFPESHETETQLSAAVEEADSPDAPEVQELIAQRNAESERLLEYSYLGRVGKVSRVDGDLIEDYCVGNLIPVIPCVAQDPDGKWLNVNGDTAIRL